MRLTFTRMADRRPVETLVERDDGGVFAMRGAGGGAELPHDLVHALVEEALEISDGVWGCVADGIVWGSMRHVSGRRPPHVGERSDRLKRERSAEIQRAEAVADVVARVARGAEVLPQQVRDAGFGPDRLESAAARLRAATARWAALQPGRTWVVEWASGGLARPKDRPPARGQDQGRFRVLPDTRRRSGSAGFGHDIDPTSHPTYP